MNSGTTKMSPDRPVLDVVGVFASAREAERVYPARRPIPAWRWGRDTELPPGPGVAMKMPTAHCRVRVRQPGTRREA